MLKLILKVHSIEGDPKSVSDIYYSRKSNDKFLFSALTIARISETSDINLKLLESNATNLVW